MTTPRRQRDRSEGTTARLLEAATQLFGDEGYASVSTDDVAARAGVTKGALYHHFSDKAALFRGVFDRAQRDLASAVSAAAANATTGWGRLLAGVDAFVDECARPSVGRIIVFDGPAVLGRDQARLIEDGQVGAMLTAALTRLQAEGELGEGDAAVRSRLILGALCEAAAIIAGSPDPERARESARPEVVAMLTGFRAER
ncbi:TetR/AcrR family transcriptional regulator [Luteimicrobium sp. NPDC057192]|uniref:TetR/AcrR family transcriptional regulator n=1 Tax=Luteimicrobium sp. NPDC057192 TaxID=3346042 RepID=UPI0036434311